MTKKVFITEHNSLKCCSIIFGSFEEYMPCSCFFNMLASSGKCGNALLFEIRYNSFAGNAYNLVWESFFITIQIVPWSVAAILLKPFKERFDSIGKCSILQKKNIPFWFRGSTFNTKVQHVVVWVFFTSKCKITSSICYMHPLGSMQLV